MEDMSAPVLIIFVFFSAKLFVALIHLQIVLVLGLDNDDDGGGGGHENDDDDDRPHEKVILPHQCAYREERIGNHQEMKACCRAS